MKFNNNHSFKLFFMERENFTIFTFSFNVLNLIVIPFQNFIFKIVTLYIIITKINSI